MLYACVPPKGAATKARGTLYFKGGPQYHPAGSRMQPVAVEGSDAVVQFMAPLQPSQRCRVPTGARLSGGMPFLTHPSFLHLAGTLLEGQGLLLRLNFPCLCRGSVEQQAL